MSDSAARLAAYLPATYGATVEDLDPIVARWLEALAFEIERIRSLLLALQSTTIPGSADDTVGGLAAWEQILQLPVQPAGVSIAQRNRVVRALLRARIVASGRQWADAVTAVIGTDDWEVRPNTPNPEYITVIVPFVEGSYTAAQVEQLVLRRSPATQIIVMGYSGRFIVGESDVGAPI